MWSVCQRYYDYPSTEEYRGFMERTARSLGVSLPGQGGPDASDDDAPRPSPGARSAATRPGTAGVPGPWVLVVGMHRSNTSALAGALGAMGLSLPPASDLVAGMPDNPNHYESASLIATGDALLEALGGRWDVPPQLDDGWEDTAPATGLDDEARTTAQRVFSGAGAKVWKDPRHCLLLPYWQRLLSGPVAAILIWRSPMEVARSLRRRGGSTLAHSLALWEHYNRQALTNLTGMPVFVVSSEALLDDPKGACRDLADWLDESGIPAPRPGGWDVDGGAAVIEPGLSHRVAVDDGELLQSQIALVGRLRGLEGAHPALGAVGIGSPSIWSTDTLTEQRALMVATDHLARLAAGNKELSEAHHALIANYHELVRTADDRVQHIRDLEAANASAAADMADVVAELDRSTADRDRWREHAQQVVEELARVESSGSWRLTAPLRTVKGAVQEALRTAR